MSTTRWRDLLTGSVTALRRAADEYRAAVLLCTSSGWSAEPDRLRPVGGSVTVTGRCPGAPALRPHHEALWSIGDAWGNLSGTLTRRYEAAALAYAYGATWATRRVLDGHAPTAVELTGHVDGLLVPGSLPALGEEELELWAGAEALARARDELSRRELAASRGDMGAPGLAGQPRPARETALGMSEAAYACGRQTEGALAFTLHLTNR